MGATRLSASGNINVNLTQPLAGVPGPAIDLTGEMNVFDTSTGLLNGEVHTGWTGAVLVASSFNLQEGAVLFVVGEQLETTADITVSGVVNANGRFGRVGRVNLPARPGALGGPGGGTTGGDGAPGRTLVTTTP